MTERSGKTQEYLDDKISLNISENWKRPLVPLCHQKKKKKKIKGWRNLLSECERYSERKLDLESESILFFEVNPIIIC